MVQKAGVGSRDAGKLLQDSCHIYAALYSCSCGFCRLGERETEAVTTQEKKKKKKRKKKRRGEIVAKESGR